VGKIKNSQTHKKKVEFPQNIDLLKKKGKKSEHAAESQAIK